jgi:hypothetical protein
MPVVDRDSLLASRQRPLALDGIADADLTEAMCLMAVKTDAQELAAVPNRFMTPAVIGAAVARWPEVARHLPEAHRTEANLVAVVGAVGTAVSLLRPEERTDAVKAAALVASGSYFALAVDALGGEKAITRDVVRASAARNWGLLKTYGERLRPEDGLPLYREAMDIVSADVRENGGRADDLLWGAHQLYSLLPEKLRTAELQRHVLAAFPKMVGHLDEEFQTEDAWFAVASKAEDIDPRKVPERFRSERVLVAVVARSPHAFDVIDEAARTTAVCEAAITRRPYALWDIPAGVVPAAAVVRKAIERQPDVLGQLRPDLVTQELADVVVAKAPRYFSTVPERFKTRPLCEAAVEAVPANLAFVPEKFRSKAMCLKAVKADVGASAHVPDAYWDEPRFRKLVDQMAQELYFRHFEKLHPRFQGKEGLLRFFGGPSYGYPTVFWLGQEEKLVRPLAHDRDVWLAAAKWSVRERDDLRGNVPPAYFREAMGEELVIPLLEEIVPLSRGALRLVPERLLTPGLVTEAIHANPDIALDAERLPLDIRLKCADAIAAGTEEAKCADLLGRIEAAARDKTKSLLREAARRLTEDTPLGARLRMDVVRKNQFAYATEFVKRAAELPYAERRRALGELVEAIAAPAPAAPARRR